VGWAGAEKHCITICAAATLPSHPDHDRLTTHWLASPALPCRNYSCIKGDPSVTDVAAGNALPASICKCDDASYCARVATGSFAVPAQVGG